MAKKKRSKRKGRGKADRTVGEKTFDKLARGAKSAKGLRFGKRERIKVKGKGKYLQPVLDQRGRVIARLPWNQKVKRQVRVAVEVYYGKESRKTLKEAGLFIPGWKPVKGVFDVDTREAVWTKSVWKGDGVPVGTPSINPRNKSFGYFGQAYDAVRPESFGRIVDKLPKHMLKRGGASIGLVFTLRPQGGGRKQEYVYFKDRIDTYVLGSHKLFLNSLWADALMDIAHEFGYAGQMEIVGVSLMVGGRAS